LHDKSKHQKSTRCVKQRQETQPKEEGTKRKYPCPAANIVNIVKYLRQRFQLTTGKSFIDSHRL